MALSHSRSLGKTRFSLLLLDDGEVLLSDLVVQYHFIPDTPVGSKLYPLNSFPQRFVSRSGNSSIRGRVKVGTRNVFFDSEDWRDPVVRIPLVSIEHARQTRDTSRSHGSDVSSTASQPPEAVDDDNSVLIVATHTVFQRELGTDHPYIHVHMRGKHLFTPLYTSPIQLLDDIHSLLHLTHSLSSRRRHDSLRDLVQQREARVPFDITLLEHGVSETAMIDAAASAVYAMSRAPGRFRITEHNVYFMPIHGESSQAVERIANASIASIRRLRHGCLNAALEVGYRTALSVSKHGSLETLMLSFQSNQIRERALKVLLKVVGESVDMYGRDELEVALDKWRNGTMSNFDYLMYLNMASGRSFNDLSQYPVFPWVLKDFRSQRLDLTDPNAFRNLSMPIGALNEERFRTFKERYEEMPPPRFYYGTHYSTPAYVINFMVRAAPAAMLRLHNGKFDTPDRLFNSMASTWHGVTHGAGDVKELIPEFYARDFSKGDASGVVPRSAGPGDFLDNVLGLDLGTRQDGKRVDDVELPPWANGSSRLFAKRLREALECEYVSRRLHMWIDLIFGVKRANAEAKNVFYTDVVLRKGWEEEEIVTKLSDEEREQIETVLLEFGRTPTQLFKHPHPPRFGDQGDDNFEHDDIAEDSSIIKVPEEQDANNEIEGTNGDDSDGEVSRGIPREARQERSRLSSSLVRGYGGGGRVWGSGARRNDSTMIGATKAALWRYEPERKGSSSGWGGARHLTANEIRDLVSVEETSEMLDWCSVGDAEGGTVVVTAWSNGSIRVHRDGRTVRTKAVTGVMSVCGCGDGDGVVLFGTRSGGLGFYHVGSARVRVLDGMAHDGAIAAVAYVENSGDNDRHIVMSGSEDGGVRAWLLRWTRGVPAGVDLVLDGDGENCVKQVAGILAMRTLSVAAANCDGTVLVWRTAVSGRAARDVCDAVWRHDDGVAATAGHTKRRMRTLMWLAQGPRRRPVLTVVHTRDHSLRMYNVDAGTERCLGGEHDTGQSNLAGGTGADGNAGNGDAGIARQRSGQVFGEVGGADVDESPMAMADVMLGEGAARSLVAWHTARTVVVGGSHGRMAEFDSTGLCVARVIVGDRSIDGIMVPPDGSGVYVAMEDDRIACLER